MGEPICGSNYRWALTSFGESYPYSIMPLTELYFLLHLASTVGLNLIRIACPRLKTAGMKVDMKRQGQSRHPSGDSNCPLTAHKADIPKAEPPINAARG